MIKIAILTSSRADYGIYLPLLKQMSTDTEVRMSLVVFGTHLSSKYGNTIDEIKKDGFIAYEKIETLLDGDSPYDVAKSYSNACSKFATFWETNKQFFDWVFVLGDRYEMAAAVASSVPFRIRLAHLHGGETTMGAIDNIYRHSISLASTLHFVSCEEHLLRLKVLLGGNVEYIYNVGALSLQNINEIELLDDVAFFNRWGISVDMNTVLVTVHPETDSYNENQQFCDELIAAIKELSSAYQFLITMPNADTKGSIFRNAFTILSEENKNINLVENLGTQSYFSAISLCGLVLGNSSSGIIEVASFGKFVLNLGDRQLGRMSNENVINLRFERQQIIENVKKFAGKLFDGENKFYKEDTSLLILNVLKQLT